MTQILNNVLRDDDGRYQQGLEIISKNGLVMIEWVNLNEGNSGDFDPDDPSDENLLRFDIYARESTDVEWEDPGDASYCTSMPASSSDEMLIKGLERILSNMDGTLQWFLNRNHKRLCETLSWMEPSWFKDDAPKSYVIFSPTESSDMPAYWSNKDGWGDLSSATVFSATEKEVFNLPMPDGQWMVLPEYLQTPSPVSEKQRLYVVAFRHGHGTDIHLVSASDEPSKEKVIELFNIDFDPEFDSIDIYTFNFDDIREIKPADLMEGEKKPSPSYVVTLGEKAIIDHAWSVYGFLVDFNLNATNGELAEQIKECYDLDEPHNRSAYDVLMKFPDLKKLQR